MRIQNRLFALAAAVLLVTIALPAQAQRLSLAERVDKLEQQAHGNPQGNIELVNQINALQAQVQAGVPGANVTVQPWFENQMFPGATVLMGSNGTLRQLTLRGDTSDAIFILYQNGLLNPNVGMSAQFGTNVYISNQGASTYDGALVS